jgi:uncharacterized protein (DUF1501 family)
MRTTRRRFLEMASASAAAAAFGLPSMPSVAHAAAESPSEFFVFVIALGGWDVTLWADPRNEAKGLVHPASTVNTDTSGLDLWVDAPLDEGEKTFELVRPARTNLVFGPGIGALKDMAERLTVVNGIAMNTVAHPDGQSYSATGRHPQGGRVAAPSVDTVLANETGRDQLLPTVSIRFPSAFVGENLDRRVVPLAIDDVGSLARTVSRASLYDTSAERDRVTALLTTEAEDLVKRSTYPDVARGLALQYMGLSRMLGSNLQDVFSKDGLKKAHPDFDYKNRFAGAPAINAAFAVEAFKRNLVRCVSFAVSGFDTHAANYKTHAQLQQETFGMLATLVRTLDETPHPTKAGAKLSDHTHVLVVSDFCRTPQINLGMGRDHYPNNSALVISPRFKGGTVFGQTDPDQLLPAPTRKVTDGERAIAPPDLLATFVSAFGVDPRKYMRDGEVVKELLAG